MMKNKLRMGQMTMPHQPFMVASMETQVMTPVMKIDYALLKAGSSSTTQLLFI